VFIKYENLIVNGYVVPMVGLGGNRRRSITEAITDLRTLVKVVEQKAKGLEEAVEQMEILDREYWK
jgi:hypothetical protein